MIKPLIAIPLFLALAACSDDPDRPVEDAPAATAGQVDGAPVDTAAEAAHAGSASAAAAELPPGVQFDAEKLLVEERNYLTGSKAQRRRTTFQFSGASADAVAEDLRQQLVAAGFNERANESADAITRLGFTRRDVGRINIRVMGAVEDVLLDGATGEVFFDWQLVAAPDTDEPEAEGDATADAADAGTATE